MLYGSFDIVFTLGKTQPPHQAHYNMLVDALSTLNAEGKLVHFIGSTNVPLKFGEKEKNILTFEERRELLTHGLIETLKARYQKDSSSIPDKFAQRIAAGTSVLTKDDFVCLPAADFSDPNAKFSQDESKATLGAPYEGVRTEAVKALVSRGMAEKNENGTITEKNGKVVLTQAFQNTIGQLVTKLRVEKDKHRADSKPIISNLILDNKVIENVSLYGPNYMGWAVNITHMLDNEVQAHMERTNVQRPRVSYQCCDKDQGTLQYILLIAAVIEHPTHVHHYAFELGINPVEMLGNNAISATDIRSAFVSILTDPAKTHTFEHNHRELFETYPILKHMNEKSLQVMFSAMKQLQSIAKNEAEKLSQSSQSGSSNTNNTDSSVVSAPHLVTRQAPLITNNPHKTPPDNPHRPIGGE